jgi:hypothetical protein
MCCLLPYIGRKPLVDQRLLHLVSLKLIAIWFILVFNFGLFVSLPQVLVGLPQKSVPILDQLMCWHISKLRGE